MNDSPGEKGRPVSILLPNGTCLPKDLYDELRREIEDALNWLPFGVPCRIEHLVTPKFWLPKGKRQRRDLGRCLAHWVNKKDLQLEFVDPSNVTHKRYRRARVAVEPADL